MSENTGFSLGLLPDNFLHPRMAPNAQKIHDGVENTCLEILDRIEQKKETATDKELMDLCLCLSGMITAWNLASIHGGYTAYPPATTGFDDEGGA